MLDLLAKLPASMRKIVAEAIQVEVEAKLQAEQARTAVEKENRLLREMLRLLRIKMYGAKADKLSDDQFDFLDKEPGVHREEVQGEADLSEEDKQALKEILKTPETQPERESKPRRGRVELPAHLPREETILACAAEHCRCGQCGAEKTVIGYEQSEELDYHPAVAFVRVIKREKRACKQCEEQGVSTAAAPAKIIAKSKASDRLIVSVLIWKYVEHLPLYRTAVRFQREYGVALHRNVLCDLMMGVGDLTQGIVREMRAELLRGEYTQADETRAPVQTVEKTGKNHQAYLWEYSCPGGNVIFDFQMGRSREGPRRMLAGFTGILQCDGFSAYDKIGGEGMCVAGCWAHVRRGFVDAVKAAGKDPVALAIVARINALYRVEREARKQKLSATERRQLRQEQSVPLMAPLKEAILEAQLVATPSSALGKACRYALNQWDRLQVYLDRGIVEIDQNLCENAIRPIALGRKNWLHIGSEQAGPRVAAIISIVETCRRLKIDLREYLLDVLPGLSERPARELSQLTPLAWKAARAASAVAA
jgi:transposase